MMYIYLLFILYKFKFIKNTILQIGIDKENLVSIFVYGSSSESTG